MNRDIVRGLALIALAVALYAASYVGHALPITDERVILAIGAIGEGCLVVLFILVVLIAFGVIRLKES